MCFWIDAIICVQRFACSARSVRRCASNVPCRSIRATAICTRFGVCGSSRCLMIAICSTIDGAAAIHPRRRPGAITFEKLFR